MFYPTPKELEILKALKKYHYMTVDQVMLATDEPSYRGTALRLAHLAPRESRNEKQEKNTIRYAWRIGRPPDKYGIVQKPAYCLSNLGKTYLEQYGMTVLPARQPKWIFLDHDLAVNDILIRVEAFCRCRPDRWELICLEAERDLKARNINLSLMPDGFFEVALLSSKDSFPTLIEMDMGSEEKPIWVEKTEKYLNILGKEAERAFGFRHPTILIVTLTERRAKLIKSWVEETVYKRGWKDTEKLFYFTWFEKGISADELLFTPRYLVGGSDMPAFLFSR
jgi:hypothetical protein